ncbi:MAG TPA: hypothetical protein VFH54_13210 [Mycobacteriales bacterium]|nr:hypothetical protein [Mycobacteriales bacterium]
MATTPPDKSRRWAAALGWSCFAVAAAALAVTALLGPSAAEAPLGRQDSGVTPPLHLHAKPPAWVVTTLLAVAVVAGAIFVSLVLAGRWRPHARRLCVTGVTVAAALTLLPPIASADPLSYAAYGRLAVTGHDPWTTQPSAVSDSVTDAVEAPWRDEPAVYGPLAVGEQAVASAVAGDDVALTVFLLDLAGLVAFAGASWLLLRRATDAAAQLRRAALWAANPLLWLQLVSGAHLDVLVATVAAAAVAIGARRPTAGGAIAGVAGVLKPTGGLAWLALAWMSRRDPRRLLLLVVAAAVVVVPSYVLAGNGALHELSRASRRVSLATPWRPLVTWTHLDRAAVGPLAIALALLLVALILRGWRTDDVAAVAAGLSLAYVLAAPYALPWYDGLPWVLLAMTAASWRDWLLLAHTTVLSLAYLPGRDAVPLAGSLHAITHAVRSDLAPALLLALLLAVVADGFRKVGGGGGI